MENIYKFDYRIAANNPIWKLKDATKEIEAVWVDITNIPVTCDDKIIECLFNLDINKRIGKETL